MEPSSTKCAYTQGVYPEIFKRRRGFLKLGHPIWFQNTFSHTYTYTLKFVNVGESYTPIFANFSIHFNLQLGTSEYIYKYILQRLMKIFFAIIIPVTTIAKHFLQWIPKLLNNELFTPYCTIFYKVYLKSTIFLSNTYFISIFQCNNK